MRLQLKKRWDGPLGVREAGTVLEVPHYLAEWLLKDAAAVQVAAETVSAVAPAPPVVDPSPSPSPSPSPNAALLSAPDPEPDPKPV